MDRLTLNKAVDDMGMWELAHNSCFTKDRNATYRDFEGEVDARDFVRKIGEQFEVFEKGCAELIDDESFDETMIDYMQYGYETKEGLLALFYRNLWAQADLYETLKQYEDLEEQGLLMKLPCKVGDTVYWISDLLPYKIKKIWINVNKKVFEVYTEHSCARMATFDFSDFGKEIFFTRAEAEEALKKLEDSDAGSI